jgi:hypothetical protein
MASPFWKFLMTTHRDIAQQLHHIAESVVKLDHVSDWADDDGELLLSHEASRLADVSPETIRRWAEVHKLGRLFAGSVWVISRQRLFRFLERRFGESAMLEAKTRAEELQVVPTGTTSTRSSQQLSTETRVVATR